MRDTCLKFPVKLYFLCSTLFLCLSLAIDSDTLKPGDILYNNETLVSKSGIFELGFFTSTETMSNHYLGIWFKNDKRKKPVWVSNRDSPLTTFSEFLTIRKSDGNLVMSDTTRQQPAPIVNLASLATSSNTTATLLDSGNLILKLNGEIIIWQSFDYPTDTFLAGMKLGFFNMDTDDVRQAYLLSWYSPSLPSSGSFAISINSDNKSQFSVFYSSKSAREVGHWDGSRFIFNMEKSLDKYNFSYESNDKEVYITFDNKGNSTASWFEIASTGEINEYTMTEQGVEEINHSLCHGVSAFNLNDCLNLPSNCKDGDNFSENKGSMPILTMYTWSGLMSLSNCEIICSGNCSCVAFASLEDQGKNCVHYYGDRKNILNIIGKGNDTIYVRGQTSSGKQRSKLWRAIAIPLTTLIIVVMIAFYFRRRTKVNRTGLLALPLSFDKPSTDDARTDHELPFLNFSCIVEATKNFSAANKIGEGGFGPVYLGMLSGQEIAVKRLSTSSGQGLEEFKTEVQLISKLQHINLVKLLGYCIEQEEKILIYEYMPNKSLDSFIFDPLKQRLIDWRRRKNIIEGIAQGLLYLHKYSRLKIIHRDLKTGNILLDSHMNPKISDFGMARIFSDNESRSQTKRVVGTYGYMSPEYGVHGVFSTKSDVYSFGVIVLEIISGRRNNSFFESDDDESTLLKHAWELWNGGRSSELIDRELGDSFTVDEVMQCVQVGLLCIQDNAEDRPTMADVVAILNSEGAVLPTPKQPFFATHLKPGFADHPSRKHSPSINLVTFSNVEPR
ncbi:G-type lectin S-receptor-like serine/threonine-protein kinase CES101 isoform X2 [Mercurialis annua]|uniref:G-type lectin S-receptor-like serine/threonine-protein kinase CES101 isoform X2 n=1 Tax=Mercurialis annua TaxID=3986 RepID=UPI00215FC995|nr:G-type lectin S-receptor-like serine/threonine-protein kinase CES101 isoform X2 [Mercurialis annua]